LTLQASKIDVESVKRSDGIVVAAKAADLDGEAARASANQDVVERPQRFAVGLDALRP
jgi:hypothetical protein